MSKAVLMFYTETYMVLELLINSCVYFSPLGKRRHFYLRLLVGAIICLLLRFSLPHNGAFTLLLSVSSVVIFVYSCCAISIQEAIYCVVCAYATQHLYFSLREIVMFYQGVPKQEAPPQLTLTYLILYFVVLVSAYFLCAKNLVDGKHYNIDIKHTLVSLIMVLTVVAVLSIASQKAYIEEARKMYIICRTYAILCCLFLLNSEVSAVKRSRLARELNTQQMIMSQQEEQYFLTKENVEIINRKCHDLKKQISILHSILPQEDRNKEILEIENSIHIYDSTFQTGNEVLDIVLTRKSLDCEAHNIQMTCVADGKLLNFIDTVDLFAIFENALDNAIEAVMNLPDQEMRMISVSVWERSGLMMFQFENYYDGELKMKDDLPITTKKDKSYHGYGIKSIKYAVQKYNGQLSIHTEKNLFVLRAAIPRQVKNITREDRSSVTE